MFSKQSHTLRKFRIAAIFLLCANLSLLCYLYSDSNLSGDEKTAGLQLSTSSYLKLTEWCGVITVHGLSGSGVLEAIQKHNAAAKRHMAAFVIADTAVSVLQVDISYFFIWQFFSKIGKE